MMKIIWILVFGFHLVESQDSVEDALLDGKSLFTNASLQTYLKDLDHLNDIYMEINDKPMVSLGTGGGSGGALMHALKNTGTKKIIGINGRPDQLPYLFQGDIILTGEQMQQQIKAAEAQLAKKKGETSRRVRSMTSNLSLRWRRFPIQYYISPGAPTSAIQAGVTRWQQLSCITFQQVNSPPSGNGLIFIQGNGCYSYIGMTGFSPQQISIGFGCESLGTVMHEIGHALGFYHEQARSDRDSYVNILWQDIQSIYQSQFSEQSAASMIDYGVAYDYGSVMHYDQFAFSSNGQAAIQTLDPNYQLTIGQRNQAAFADVKKINLAYCNASCSNVLSCVNGGYTDPMNCEQCRCPDGLGGTLCDQAAASYTGCSAGNLQATSTLQTITAQGSLVCNYLITAPPGKRIYFQASSLSFPYQAVCSQAYLELKYNADLGRTGARLCRQASLSGMTSGGSSMVVIFQGGSTSRFTLSYRYDPPDTSPTTTTTTTTTQSTQSTQSTQPTTRPGTTTTTTTTTRTTTTTTTTRRITWPTTQPSRCSPWNFCSQPCGGCGIQSRVCSTGVQTQPCNLVACRGFFCCSPFIVSRQGTCIKPASDNETEPTDSTPAVQPSEATKALTPKPTTKPAPKTAKKPKPTTKKPNGKIGKKIGHRAEFFDDEGSGEEPNAVTRKPITKPGKLADKIRRPYRKSAVFVDELEKNDSSTEKTEA
ncbi:unnamed protein product, partial [Mesorhabditis belari]|uniref:Metalloendopeptidase n=1 Tax=Mesorhabditis belari TaxID=2138241 RepID=A0AAF3ETT8_9BILA